MKEDPETAKSSPHPLHTVRPMRSPGPAHAEQLGHIVLDASLGGLGDKTVLDMALAGEWGRCKAEKAPLTLMMLRMDPLTATGGGADRANAAPTLCERAIAAALKAFCIRPRDRSFCLEGGTFAAVLPGTNSDGSRHVTGRILWAVRDLQAMHRATPGERIVPVAVGVATAMSADCAEHARLLDASLRALAAAEKEASKSADGAYASDTSSEAANIASYGAFFRLAGDADPA